MRYEVVGRRLASRGIRGEEQVVQVVRGRQGDTGWTLEQWMLQDAGLRTDDGRRMMDDGVRSTYE